MKKRIKNLINRIKEQYNWSRMAVQRTKERIYRNRPLIKGFYIKLGSMELKVHPSDARPIRHLYKWTYGKRN